jgi:hypothetical protein
MRKSLALTAAGALVGSMFAVSANAQTAPVVPVVTPATNNNRTINVTVRVNGPVPAGTTSVGVTVTCRFLQGSTTTNSVIQSLSAAFVPPSGTTAFTFGLQAGTDCFVQAGQQPGTGAGVSAGAWTVSVGGATSSSTLTGAYTTGTGQAIQTLPVAVQGGTDIAITLGFPQVTVKKVVVGDEPTAGFAYPMAISCTGAVSPFVVLDSAANGGLAVGTLIVPGGAGNYITVTSATPVGGLPAGSYRLFDGRTTAAQQAAADAANPPGAAVSIIHNAAAWNTLPAPSGGTILDTQFLLSRAISAQQITTTLAPSTAVPGGQFTLTGAGATSSRVFGVNDFPGMTGNSTCTVREINANTANLSYSSLNGATGATAVAGDTVQANGGTLTVTNSFTGDLIVSKVVTGDPKTNIAIYEISVACDKGGPRETFLLKDRQSRRYTGIASGTNCLVTETRSDGATTSYSDNSGDNTTDGRVTIKQTSSGCRDANLTGTPDCIGSVIVTNSYVAATTAAPATTAAAPATAAPATTAAPAVVPEAPVAIEEEPTFTG